MTTMLISAGIFLVACAGLALGQLFGRPPLRGRCAPGDDAVGAPRAAGGCGAQACCLTEGSAARSAGAAAAAPGPAPGVRAEVRHGP